MSYYTTTHESDQADMARWHRMIGKRVFKRSGKPFKSKQDLASPSAVVEHPFTKRPAFTFSDCEGIVECRTCVLYVDDPDQYTFVHRGYLEAGLDPHIVQAEISRHLQGLFALSDDVENRDEAIAAFKALEADVNRLIQGEAI